MGKKLYTTMKNGDISIRTQRTDPHVRIPNYVYDLWLPIIGATGIGIYGVYCRYERGECVKGLSQAKIAKACRVGTKKLAEINMMLEDCGFIEIEKPSGHERLMHWTIEITVLDPPTTVSKTIKEKYQPPSKYETIPSWLVEDASEKLGNNADDATQQYDKELGNNAKIESLGLNHLDIEVPPPEKPEAEHPPINVSRLLRGTLTKGEEEETPSQLASYIEQQFNSVVPSGQRNSLARGYTEQLPGGKKRKHPSPDELWLTHPQFPEFVEKQITWVKGKASGSNHAQRAKAVNLICRYKGNKHAWLEWLSEQQQKPHYTLIEDEPIDEEPAVGGTLDMQAIRREFIEEQRKKGVVVNL